MGGNYKFVISLDGDRQVSSAINKLTNDADKLSSIGTRAPTNLLKLLKDNPGLLSRNSGLLGLAKELQKTEILAMKPFKIFGGWGEAILRAKVNLNNFWTDAIKNGTKFNPAIQGLRDITGKDIAKVLSLPDINSYNATKGLPEQDYAKALAGISKMGNFDGIGKAVTKGLREVTGKDLAKVQGLGDITQFDSIRKGIDWKKLLLGAGTAMLNPWIGSRLLSDAIPKNGGGAGGKGGGTAAGIFGEGGAIGFAEFYIAIEIFKKSVELLRSMIQSSLAKADKLYSSALQSGLGLGFSTKRSTLAEIMGVSEQDVFRFGQQMAYLNPRIEGATKILAETAPGLAQASYNWKILKLDFEAVSAQIANALLPAINNLLMGLDGVAKWLQAHPDAFNQMAKMGAFGPSGGLINAVYGLLKPELNADNARMGMGAMPSPNSWMKQLPASSWEKMGLVIGGGSLNYTKQISQNTARTYKVLERIEKHMGIGRGRGTSVWGGGITTNNP